MLKKILILVLILNTQYVSPSDSSPGASGGLAVICTVSGVICARRACKNFKKWWQTLKEVDHQTKILKDMGAEIYLVTESEFGYNCIVTKEHYTMEMPSNFSQEQVEKAKEHWRLFLAKKKNAYRTFGWAALETLGGLILTPIGILLAIDCIDQLCGG